MDDISDAYESAYTIMLNGAADQLMGQIASAKIPLSRMISPQLYWVMSGDEFTLDINNPDEPKILVVGNNPYRQNIYGAALGLYNSRIVKLINKKGQLKSSVVIDELPTIYFKGLDSLMPPSKISNLTQGMFIGTVSDNFDERIEQKMFHARLAYKTSTTCLFRSQICLAI